MTTKVSSLIEVRRELRGFDVLVVKAIPGEDGHFDHLGNQSNV